MKKIILFTGGVETLDFFSLQLSKAFNNMGHEVFIFDLLEEEKCCHELLRFIEEQNTVMISFNFTGIRGEEIFFDKKGKLFWDYYHIPCFNIVVDHPFYYHELIRQRPHLYRQLCIDRYHEQYMKRFFPEVTNNPFMVLGGTELDPKGSYLPLERKTMDIVFTGNYTPPQTFDKHITRIDEEYTAFYHAIIDDLITHPERTMEEVFEFHIKKEMGEISEDELKLCMENMIFIDLYVRFYYRGLVIKTLVDHGLKVHVFGKGWELLACKHPENLIDGDYLNSLECLQKISQAKISLNVMPWFKDGAHDRIFNTMLNGALCLTDDSIYLREELQEDVNVKFYSLSEVEKLPGIVTELLGRPDRMKEIIAAGYQRAVKSHSWDCRARILEQIIEIS
jgi:hypothetical protein